MSELTARQAIQSTARGASIFANADVTLNDWSILDAPGATDNAPFLIILGSEGFSARWPSMSGAETSWEIAALLLEGWDDDWPTTLESFLASRQSLIDAFNASGGGARAPGGSIFYNIDEIRGAGPLFEYTQGDLSYMAQEIIFVTEEMA